MKTLKDILDTVREPLVVLDEDLKVLYVSSSFLTNFGLNHRETAGKQLYRLGNEQWNIPKLLAALDKVISKGTPLLDFEVELDFPSLGKRAMMLNARRIIDGHNDEPMILLAIENIAGEGLAEDRAHLAAIVESSDDAMISKTIDGTITSWNRAAEQLFGYVSEEAVGHNITLIIPPDRLLEEKTILERLKRGQRIEHFETRRMRKDGTIFDVSLTVSPIKDNSGRVIGASKVLRDITERKAADKALQEAHDRLESLVEKRTAVVRRLSLKLLTLQDEERRSISRELHDGVGQYLARIKMGINRLKHLESTSERTETLAELSESLDKCMAETRTISYLLHPPLLDELGFPAAAKWFIEGFSERSGIKINIESFAEDSSLLHSVGLPLFRILQAALSNVHRHARSPSADIRFTISAAEAKLEVRDHGKGIDPGLLEQFNRDGAGVGVGLAGMRERLRELGGHLEVESDASGTLIRAVIPVALTEAKKRSWSAD